jgi:glyoxylate reductase
MKSTAVLVNIARGGVVDTAALVAALQVGQISAAALDVTDPEPLPRDHPLLSMANVVIAPHLGSATEQTRRRMAEMSIENLLAGLSGQPLPWRVG